MSEVEINGPFVRLTPSTWVRHDAILVIKTRPLPEDKEGSTVIVRGQQSGGLPGQATGTTVWTDHGAAEIIDAIIEAAAFSG